MSNEGIRVDTLVVTLTSSLLGRKNARKRERKRNPKTRASTSIRHHHLSRPSGISICRATSTAGAASNSIIRRTPPLRVWRSYRYRAKTPRHATCTPLGNHALAHHKTTDSVVFYRVGTGPHGLRHLPCAPPRPWLPSMPRPRVSAEPAPPLHHQRRDSRATSSRPLRFAIGRPRAQIKPSQVK